MPTVNLPLAEFNGVSHEPSTVSASPAVEKLHVNCPPLNAPGIGLRLKTLRETYGLSQRELAKRAGIANSNISMIEQDQVSPSVQSLGRILNAFPMSLADFFAWDITVSGTYVYPAAVLQQTMRGDAAGVLTQVLAQDNSDRQLDMQIQSFPAGFIGQLTRTVPMKDWCGVVTQGYLQLLIGSTLYELSSGDGFYIPHGLQFRFSNPVGEVASIIGCSLFVHSV